MKKQFLVSALLILNSHVIADDKIDLGKALFFDVNLSKNRTQACATCHSPRHGFIDDRNNIVHGAASLGDDGKSIGDRNAPTASYAMFSPKFHYDQKKKLYKGGQFHDGRETDLSGQAKGPPTNPGEMAMPDTISVVARIQENPYYVTQFKKVFGKDVFSQTHLAYGAMSDSIAAFESTEEFSPFDSKYDRYLEDKYEMTILEELGMSLFFSNNNTNCASCHMLKNPEQKHETFSNYEYHNIGVPKNTSLRAKNGKDKSFVDTGLFLNPKVKEDTTQKGKFKTPTLRNIAVTAPYMHNGVFQDLDTVIRFYDQYNNPEQDTNPETKQVWKSPEVAENISKEELKSKKLTERKTKALVAFLRLLTDEKYEHLLPHETKAK